MKNIFKVVFFSTLGFGLTAQTLENVNLLNTTGLYGSPRYVGMGGAFTALGNDLSALHINPASGAIYRNDNFGLSLGFQGQTNSTLFLNNSFEDETIDPVFQNIGLVKKFGKKDKFFFGLSYNRLADFNTSYNTGGVNVYQNNGGIESGFTLGEYWLAAANGFTVQELEANGLIDEASAASADVLLRDENNDLRVIGFDFVDDASSVNYQFTETGSRSEVAINFGGTLNSMFSWGAGVGIPSMNYTNSTTLTESGYADTSFFNSVDLVRSNSVEARGINLKAGIIFRPVQWLRIGASYQSPSWYYINEIYTTRVNGYARDGSTFAGTEYIFDDISYGVSTPSIYRVGLATVLGKHAIITGDVEITDPSKTTINGRNNNNYERDEDFYQANTESTVSLKLGGELRFGPVYLRGGAQHRASNFVNPDDYQGAVNIYTGGIGYKKGRFGFDVAYMHAAYSQTYLAHRYLAYEVNNGVGQEDANIDRALVKNDITKGSVVLGFNLSF
jgi:hypothetical protein